MDITLHKGDRINIIRTDRAVIHGTLEMDIIVDDKGIPGPDLYSVPILVENTGMVGEVPVKDIRYISRSLCVKKQDMVS